MLFQARQYLSQAPVAGSKAQFVELYSLLWEKSRADAYAFDRIAKIIF